MRFLAWNLVLALAWCALRGDLSLGNLTMGFAIGYLALRVPGRGSPNRYFHKGRELLSFVVYLVGEIAISALRIAYDVITPRHHMRPAILRVPLDARTDAEITVLSALLSLTPGSVVVDLAGDRSAVFVHFMYVDDPEATIARTKRQMERRVLELLR